MGDEAKLILLRGNSGSGKSTVAKLLQQKFSRGTLVIPQDTVRREMLWVRDEPNTPAISLMIHLARYGRENCPVVIIEGILYSDWYMELFRVLKAEFPVIYAYYYDLSIEETLARHATKSVNGQFGRPEMERWWRDQDYIGIIPETRIGPELSLDETVGRIVADVTGT